MAPELKLEALSAGLARARALERLPEPPARALIRRRAGLSLNAVADAVGVHATNIARWESGKTRPTNGEHAAAYLAVLTKLARETGSADLLPEAEAGDGRAA